MKEKAKILIQKKDGEFNYDDLFPHYGGELTSEVTDRMYKTLETIMKKEDHINVLAVSHAGACYCFLAKMMDPNIIRNNGGLPNCGILHFTFENNEFKFKEMIK